MPNLEDPLHNYAAHSLFPQTLSSFPNPPSHPDHLIQLPVRDPEKLLEQAKNILKETSSQNYDVLTNDQAFGAQKVLEELPRRERRPGLDRKRRKFELQPSLSLSAVNLEPTLDIDKFKDPEEFFKAFERLRNAKKEIAKQTGNYVPDLDPNQAALKRSRRQGIPGRNRNVKYKHLYPKLSSQDIGEEGFVDSALQTQPEEQIQDQVVNFDDGLLDEMENENVASQQIEKDDDAHGEMEVEVIGAENGIGKLLHELLSHDYEELDGEGATNLLQDRLQIKPLAIEKLHIPEMQKIRRIDLEPARENLQKSRNVLSDINNLLKVTRNKTPAKQQRLENSASSLGSPTPPKSPFASLSLLKRRILQSSSQNDPFSAADIDQPILINDSPSIEMEKNTSGKFKCLVEKEHSTSHDSSSPSLAAGNITDSTDKFENHNVINRGSENEVHLSDSCSVLEEDNAGHQNDKEEDVQNNGPSKSVDMVNDVLNEIVASPQPHADTDSTVEKLDEISNPCDNLKDVAIENHMVDGHSVNRIDGAEEIQDTSLEQPNERNQESYVPSLDEQTNVKPNAAKKRKGKVFKKRQSLAAAGTSWDAGLRRSTRIKSRPLEYWRGEKFLYGRVHSSLPTIIGIKCESPGEVKGKGVMKVKSFVSDQYKDLIELAAL